MSETTALTVVSGSGPDKETALSLMNTAKDVAGICREIVMRTAMDIKGKKYVKVEGWQSIAAVYGCVPSIKLVEEDERGGVRAVAELRKHDGTVLATAEGYVGMDEGRWANEPAYSRRGMAQTRAVSRVCRSVFAFVVTLIDEGLQTTPAEEIPMHDATTGEVHVPRATSARQATVTQAKQLPAPEKTQKTKVRFGKSKGKFLCDIDDADLAWQMSAAKKSADANDPKWGDHNREWLATVEAEVSRRKA